MENSYKFFNNKACVYLPCHDKPEKDEFNCLFCYCPLFLMGEDCSGLFVMNHGVKDCSACHLPHVPEFYDTIVKKLGDYIYDKAE